MSNKIEVLGIELDLYSAKEAIKAVTDFIKEGTISLVEVVNVESVMRRAASGAGNQTAFDMDMILPGDEAILEVAEVNDEKLFKDVENEGFVKLLFQYLHKNQMRVFLLADTREDVAIMKEYLEKEYTHIEIAGSAEINEGTDCDDMITNLINGTGAECILANVESDRQEQFICRCKDVLNASLWIGLCHAETFCEENIGIFRQFISFINRRSLKRKANLQKKKRSA